MKKAIKIILIILLIIVILIGGAVAGAYWYIQNKISKVNHIEVSDVEVNEGVTTQSRYRQIALLGIDTRDDKYTGCRSDCIIIVTIDDQEKEVKLTSIYRDTYLDIPQKGLDKATHAYAYGGASRTLSTLNRNLDLNLEQVVVVNFYAAKDIVDQVGGIDMTIDSDEVKFIKGIDTPGTYHLTGEQALAYSRIRKVAGGDYKRTERMRDVIKAVFQQAKKKNISEINDLIEKILPEISTNVESKEIFDSIFQLYSYNIVESIGWPYETTGKTINGVWYGMPIDLEENVKRLHKEVFNDSNYEPSQTVKEISDRIKKIM